MAIFVENPLGFCHRVKKLMRLTMLNSCRCDPSPSMRGFTKSFRDPQTIDICNTALRAFLRSKPGYQHV
eukprot:5947212-Amphidinium_carterae.1